MPDDNEGRKGGDPSNNPSYEKETTSTALSSLSTLDSLRTTSTFSGLKTASAFSGLGNFSTVSAFSELDSLKTTPMFSGIDSFSTISGFSELDSLKTASALSGLDSFSTVSGLSELDSLKTASALSGLDSFSTISGLDSLSMSTAFSGPNSLGKIPPLSGIDTFTTTSALSTLTNPEGNTIFGQDNSLSDGTTSYIPATKTIENSESSEIVSEINSYLTEARFQIAYNRTYQSLEAYGGQINLGLLAFVASQLLQTGSILVTGQPRFAVSAIGSALAIYAYISPDGDKEAEVDQ